MELRERLVLEGLSGAFAHRQKIEALEAEFSHSIRYICQHENGDGTCLTFALGLLDHCFNLCDVLQQERIYPAAEFISWLLDSQKLREITSSQVDSLALYFDEETWTHAGVVQRADRIISKWGTYGVYEHHLSEVPTNYGLLVRFFLMPSPDEICQKFFEYGCVKLELKPIEADRLKSLISTRN